MVPRLLALCLLPMPSLRVDASVRSLLAVLVLVVLLGGTATGCGESGDEPDGEAATAEPVRFVYVSWIEGIAMTHVMKVLVEDSLGYEAPLVQAGGAAFAFSAVSEGDADVFLDAWLPTTHGPLWDQYGDRLVDLGPIYDSTTVGLVVPDYVGIKHVRDLGQIRGALEGEIVGIESGAAINDQTQEVLAQYGLAEQFDVVSSSDAAMVSALRRATNNQEPVVITGWKPHWMWGRFDLRYLQGARTGDTDVFGEPENIHKLVRPGFRDEMPADVVALLEAAHLGEAAMTGLMTRFRPGEENPLDTARRWIQDHPDLVRSWLSAAKQEGAS